MRLALALAPLVVALCACTSYSAPKALANGSYLLTASGVHSRSDVSENAAARAEKLCATQGRSAEIIEISYGTRFLGPEQASITFRCVVRPVGPQRAR